MITLLSKATDGEITNYKRYSNLDTTQFKEKSKHPLPSNKVISKCNKRNFKIKVWYVGLLKKIPE